MYKLQYYFLLTDCILKENLPKSELVYKSVPSNYHDIKGDEALYEIGNATIIDQGFW